MTDRALTISRYKSRYDRGKKLKIESLAWADLVTLLTTFKVTRETFEEYHSLESLDRLALKDVGYFVGGEFDPPYRKAQNLKYRSVLTLDLDHLDVWDIDSVRECYSEYAYVLHSSHSHSEDSPRLRIVFPLTRDVTAQEYEPVARAVAARLDMDLFDDTTYQFSRVMFLPSRSTDGHEVAEENFGDWLDPDAFLSGYDDWRDFGSWPQSTREIERGGLRERKEKAANPFEIPGVIGAFNRAYPIDEAIVEFELPYVESGKGDDRYTYQDGSSADGAVFYRDDGHLFSHHETDPAHGNRNAWDLVRLHRFGDLDTDETVKGLQIKDYPSQKKMVALAKTLKPVLAEWDSASKVDPSEEFEYVEHIDGEAVTHTVKSEELSFNAIKEQIAEWGNDHGRLTQEEVDEIVLRVAAAGPAIAEAERGVLAEQLKLRYTYDGATKTGVLADFKARAKALKSKGSDGEEILDIQVEFIRNFLDRHYGGGRNLRRFGGQFWVYNGQYWELAEDEKIAGQLANSIIDLRTNADFAREKKALAAAVGENQTSTIFQSLWAMFKALRTKETSRGPDPMGLRRQFLPRMINCASGELYFNDEGGRKLKPHNPRSLCTSVIPVEWNKEAECPEWDRFCAMTFAKSKDPKGMQRHLEELCGYILNQSREFRVWVLLYGGTASGKSTIGKLLVSLMEGTVKSVPISGYDGSNSHATAGLIGKQLLLDDDYPEGQHLPDGLLKQISEEKSMTANPKGKDEFDFVARVVPLICSNSPPASRDTTGALYDRAMVFPLNHSLPRPERDEARMRRMMIDEREGVFNRFVQGLSRLFKRGDWDFPVDCTLAWETWQNNSNPLPLFLRYCFREDPEGEVPRPLLYLKYKAFMQEEQGSVHASRWLTRNHFYRKVADLWGDPVHTDRGYVFKGRRFLEGSVDDGTATDQDFDKLEESEEEWDR